MDDITAALKGATDPDIAINRHLLKAAVMRQIICPRSNVVLDIRSAVLFTATAPDGKARCECIDGAAWDAIADTLTVKAAELGVTLEIIDGRIINAGKRRR